MIGVRPYVLANLSRLARLPAGSPDAVDRLRQQLHAIGISQEDRRGIGLAARVLASAEDLHAGLGQEPEYVKRARLNYALARLCWHLESRLTDEFIEPAMPADEPAKRETAG
jgi:hypothetical protein